MTRKVSRRQFAAVLGTAAGVGLAGCGAGANNTTNGTNGTVGTVEDVTDEETDMAGTEDEETEAETETGEPPETTDDPAAAVEEGSAVVRIAHLSPDAPNVDVSVAGATILEDVSFGTVSDYYVLEPDTYAVAVTPTGEEEAVIEQDVEFANGAFTVAAFGEVSGGNQEFAVGALEDRVEAPASDTAAVRVVHASPDAPPVSVAVAGGDTLVESVAFAEASDYAEVPAGDYSLEIAAAEGMGETTGTPSGTEEGTGTEEAGTGTEEAGTGTEDGGTGTASDGGPVATVDVALAGGTVSSAFATGYLSPEGEAADAPFEVILTVDAGESMGTGTAEGTETGTETGTEDEGTEEAGTGTEEAGTGTEAAGTGTEEAGTGTEAAGTGTESA